METIRGTVTPHRGRGRQLGFPTANFPAPDQLTDGVYAGYCLYQNQRFPSAIFVGAAITFDETDRQVEVYVLDQAIDMTGPIIVELTQLIRPNRHFAESAELKQQIEEDIVLIRQCLQELLHNN